MPVVSDCTVNARDGVLDTNSEAQLRLRQMQTRYFDTADKKKTVEAVMAPLQDLGFVIDKASLELGTVTGTKLNRYLFKMTVSVTPRGKDKMTVRTNAQYNIYAVEDPLPCQNFFNALDKSMFLQANL